MLNGNKAQRYVIWLKGFLDATGNNPTEGQVNTIKSTLDGIFEHEAKKQKVEKIVVKVEDFEISNYFDDNGIFPSENDTILRC